MEKKKVATNVASEKKQVTNVTSENKAATTKAASEKKQVNQLEYYKKVQEDRKKELMAPGKKVAKAPKPKKETVSGPTKKDYGKFLADMKAEIHSLGFCCTIAKNAFNKQNIDTYTKKYSEVFAKSAKFKSDLLNTFRCNRLTNIVSDYLPGYMDGSKKINTDIKLIFTSYAAENDKNVDRLAAVYEDFKKNNNGGYIPIEKAIYLKKKGFFSPFETKAIPHTEGGLAVIVKEEIIVGGMKNVIIKAVCKRKKYALTDVFEAALRFVQDGADFSKYKETEK